MYFISSICCIISSLLLFIEKKDKFIYENTTLDEPLLNNQNKNGNDNEKEEDKEKEIVKENENKININTDEDLGSENLIPNENA